MVSENLSPGIRPKSAQKTPGSTKSQKLLTSFFGKPVSTTSTPDHHQPPITSQSISKPSPLSTTLNILKTAASSNLALHRKEKNRDGTAIQNTTNFKTKPSFDEDLDRMFDEQEEIIIRMELDEPTMPSCDVDSDFKDADELHRKAIPKGSTLKRSRLEENDVDQEYANNSAKTPSKSSKKRKRRRQDDDVSDSYKPEGSSEASQDESEQEFEGSKSAKSGKSLTTPAKDIIKFSFKTPSSSNPITSETSLSAFKTPRNTTPGNRPISSDKKSFVDESEKKSERLNRFTEKNEKRYSFLKEIRDADGRAPDDPEYNPRTLLIPKTAFNTFTEFERQFWNIKKDYWDTIVFFKKGKFYELYEKDADIGSQVFDFKMTDRTNMRMVGVPESSFDHWAAQFLAKGYKVARVDQMENAVGKTLRERESNSKADKVIRRELTSVLTVGTLVDPILLTNDMSTYCLSMKEVLVSEYGLPTFGICFVDTATAEFRICSFQDDAERTRLETLLLQLKPRELVLEKSALSQKTARIVKNSCGNWVQINYLRPKTEFWDADITADEIRSGGYFVKNGGNVQHEFWPKVLQDTMKHSEAMSALGGLIWYLRSCKLDKDLISAGNFHHYDPVQEAASLVLDGQTLLNLEVFENTIDGSENGTLFSLLNHCTTACGKRLFKRWVCHPLRSVSELEERLDATDDLLEADDLLEILTKLFAKMPDLERVISRIHTGVCKVTDFVKTLDSLESLLQNMKELSNTTSFKSKRLPRLITKGFPDGLEEKLKWFHDAFDHDQALSDDKINPYEGYDEVYDDAQTNLERIDTLFEEHKKECETELKCRSLNYKDMGKEIYQLEVPVNVKVPKGWVQMSKTQKIVRYYNPTIKRLAQEMIEAKETREMAIRDMKARMYAKFDENYPEWLKAVKSVAEIDCLLSLARCRKALGEPCCRPQFLSEGPSVLHVSGLRHPCVVPGLGSDFIPNNTVLGGESGHTMILLTGPNMGGKSTLLRQSCIAVIMAQLGCFVPAESCVLTPFDRVFTRIGANDNILAGQSTFMVELAETSRILREATPRSLVILDELGRGTSTFDGFAIAYSCLHHLVQRVRCLGLFSTHYQSLTNEFADNSLVGLRYMSSVADEETKQVTFLYKLENGVCPKSHGMHVAHIAGVSRVIVDRADEVAARFEQNHQMRQVMNIGSKCLPTAREADFVELLKASSIMDDDASVSTKQQSIIKNIWQSLQKQK